MFHIDWDAVRQRLPIYAYEYYDDPEDSGRLENYRVWRPHEHKGEQPPAGWANIDRDDSNPELWRQAVDEWVKTVVRPNEKAVWYDTATGDFSNTFRLGELLDSTLAALDDIKIGREELAEKTSKWRLIVYRCEGSNDFEFSNLMRIVTKPREAR